MFITTERAARIAAALRGQPLQASPASTPAPESPRGLPNAVAAWRAKRAQEQAEREELDAIAAATMPRAQPATEPEKAKQP